MNPAQRRKLERQWRGWARLAMRLIRADPTDPEIDQVFLRMEEIDHLLAE